jgi:glutamyl-tRNA reductase
MSEAKTIESNNSEEKICTFIKKRRPNALKASETSARNVRTRNDSSDNEEDDEDSTERRREDSNNDNDDEDIHDTISELKSKRTKVRSNLIQSTRKENPNGGESDKKEKTIKDLFTSYAADKSTKRVGPEDMGELIITI